MGLAKSSSVMSSGSGPPTEGRVGGPPMPFRNTTLLVLLLMCRAPSVSEEAQGGTPELHGRRVPSVSSPSQEEPHYELETTMPFINVKVIENVFTPEQKQEVVRRLTDAMVSIEGENMRAVTWVVVEEVASGDWGIGGQPMTTEDVTALAAGGAPAMA